MRAWFFCSRPWCELRIQSSSRWSVFCRWVSFFSSDPQQLGLLRQPGGIVALEGQPAAVLQLQDPLGDVVEEVAVVGDDDHRAGVLAQRLLQPLRRSRRRGGWWARPSSSRSGFSSRAMHRATRRRSPPESSRTGRVVGRQHQGVGGDVHQPVQLPAVAGVDLLLEPAHLVHQLVQVVRLPRARPCGRRSR